MNTTLFFQKIRSYTTLSMEAETAWTNILQKRTYKKGELFISVGQVPRKVAFIQKGLLYQYYITEAGDTVIKYFFPEGRIAGSIVSTLTKAQSNFAVSALENTTVLEYDFNEFKKLSETYPEIAAFYIKYMEQHWIIEKEPLEISLRNDTARTRYDMFIKQYPELIKRLKKHHIAAYLGITPTQLSRIFFANK